MKKVTCNDEPREYYHPTLQFPQFYRQHSLLKSNTSQFTLVYLYSAELQQKSSFMEETSSRNRVRVGGHLP